MLSHLSGASSQTVKANKRGKVNLETQLKREFATVDRDLDAELEELKQFLASHVSSPFIFRAFVASISMYAAP